MNKQSGRIGLYLVLIVMLVAGYFYLNNQVASQSSYSMESMKQAAEDGKLSSAKIYQNREVPTGSVVADIEGEGKKKVYVTDVKDAQKLLEGYGIHPEVADVPQESVFMTTFFPVLLTGGLVIFLFLMMNRQMSGGGGNAKMMNFGKSRARMMLPDDKKVTFQNVAGLQEEKEELELLPQTDKELLDKIVNFINNHLDNPDLTVDSLVEEAGISRSALFKKIKTLIGISPMELIKNIRLKKAAELVKEGSCNFTQIAYKTGFNDSQYFSKCFKKQMGVTPTEYKDKQKQ